MDWQEYFADAETLIATLQQRLAQDAQHIRYTNLKYKCYGQPETKWLYHIALSCDPAQLIITQQDSQQTTSLPLADLEYLRVRPFYYATCIGSKSFVLYAYKPVDE